LESFYYVHFLRNALVTNRATTVSGIYDRDYLIEVRRGVASWLCRWQLKYPKLCDWIENNIQEASTSYRLPLE